MQIDLLQIALMDLQAAAPPCQHSWFEGMMSVSNAENSCDNIDSLIHQLLPCEIGQVSHWTISSLGALHRQSDARPPQ